MNILKALERKKGEMEEAMVSQEVVSSEDQLAAGLWRRGEKTFAQGRRCRIIDMMNNNEHALYEYEK